MTTWRECSHCHGRFPLSQISIYKGRYFCDDCRGDEEMWDAQERMEHRLDDYLRAVEDGEY